MNIMMTKQMIIEEMHQVACEERAIEFAINRLDFDGLLNALNELNEHYLKYAYRDEGDYSCLSFELRNTLKSFEYAYERLALEIKNKYYENAFFFDSEVLIDYMQWFEGSIDELVDKYNN